MRSSMHSYLILQKPIIQPHFIIIFQKFSINSMAQVSETKNQEENMKTRLSKVYRKGDCTLYLNQMKITDAYIGALIQMPLRTDLKQLFLRKNLITDQSLKLLSQTEWPNLTRLLLDYNKITKNGVKNLINTSIPMLKQLNLDDNRIKDAGVKILVKGDWKLLNLLRIRNCDITPQGLKTIVAGNWPELRGLQLSKNNLEHGQKSLTSLVTGNWPKLTNLMVEWLGKQSKLPYQCACQFRSQIQYRMFQWVEVVEQRDYGIRGV